MSDEYEYKTQSDLPQLSPRDQAVAAAHRQALQYRKQRQKHEERRKTSPQPKLKRANNKTVLSRSSSLDQYERLKTLGKGSFGRVDKVRNISNGKIYALKTIRYQFGELEERRQAFEEAKLLKKLSHPSIVRFHEAFETSHHEKMCIVMELCQGTLVQAQEHAIAQNSHFNERRILSWLFQVVLALEYLHGQKLLHRDIKPANIFLSSHGYTVKLGDFGLVRALEQTFDMAKTRCGTPLYNCSPEICESRPYNSATDMWGLGVVMYELLQLRLPFTGQDKNDKNKPVHVVQLLRSVVNDQPDPLPTRYSSGLRKLIIKHLLNKDHRNRPTCSDILNIQFIKSHMELFFESPHPSVPQDLLDVIDIKLAQIGGRRDGGSGDTGGSGGTSGTSGGSGGNGGSGGRGRREKGGQRDKDRDRNRDTGGSNNHRKKSRSPARKPPSSSPDYIPDSGKNDRRRQQRYPSSESPNYVPTSLMEVANDEVEDSLRQLSNEFDQVMKR